VATHIGYHESVLGSRGKCRRQKGRYQTPGVGIRGLGSLLVISEDIYDTLH